MSGTFDGFNSQLQAKTLKATRSALALPMDVAFHRSMDTSFSKDLDVFSSRVLSLTNKLLALVANADPTQSARTKGKAKLENQDDVVDNFHSVVVDSMDQLLERTVSTTNNKLDLLINLNRIYVWTNISVVQKFLRSLLILHPRR
jgi:exosome complex exonuclease RRP6